jgi:hypothetical protein
VTRFTQRLAFAALLVTCASSAARATSWMPAGVGDGYAPRVPISAFARPAAWFDPSRMHLSTSVTVGSGFGGTTQALQVTSLGYRFAAPLWMNVSVGNGWGLAAARGNSSLFLEGLDLGYQPFSSFQIQVHYRDLRSPLQLSPTARPFDW